MKDFFNTSNKNFFKLIPSGMEIADTGDHNEEHE